MRGSERDAYVSTALPPCGVGAVGAVSSTLLCGAGVGARCTLCGVGVDSAVFVLLGGLGGATSVVLPVGPVGGAARARLRGARSRRLAGHRRPEHVHRVKQPDVRHR